MLSWSICRVSRSVTRSNSVLRSQARQPRLSFSSAPQSTARAFAQPPAAPLVRAKRTGTLELLGILIDDDFHRNPGRAGGSLVVQPSVLVPIRAACRPGGHGGRPWSTAESAPKSSNEPIRLGCQPGRLQPLPVEAGCAVGMVQEQRDLLPLPSADRLGRIELRAAAAGDSAADTDSPPTPPRPGRSDDG